MKSILAISLAAIAAFSTVGCSGDSAGDPPPPIDKAKDAEVKKDGGSTPTQAND